MPPQTDELSTWKEIAGYLGVSVRTAQNWNEQLGLPVRRITKGPRGRVVAFASELDRWKAQRLGVSPIVNSDFGNPEPSTSAILPPVAQPENTEALTPEAEPVRQTGRLVRTWIFVPVLVIVAVTFATYWREAKPQGQPSSYKFQRRLLTVFDEHDHWLWDKVLPESLTEEEVSGHRWPHKFIDLKGDGQVSLLFGAGRSLYCFDRNGKVSWTRVLGREVVSGSGQRVPDNYYVSLVDALSKPRADGGRIIVGAHRGPSALFVVELLTNEGRKVADYFHFGWLFASKTGVLDKSGHEDIFLGGVDDVSSNASPYAATLVVIDPYHFQGQATTLARDTRALRAIPQAQEKAVVLTKDFAPRPSPSLYSFGSNIELSKDTLDLKVTQDEKSGAYYLFNEKLELQSVTPELFVLNQLQMTLLKNVDPKQAPAVIQRALGKVMYIRNDFR